MVADAVRAAAMRLGAAGIEGARLDAELLAAHILGLSRLEMLARPHDVMTSPEITALHTLLARREAHEPLAYILGRREFWSLEFEVGPGLLVPRADSETLVEAVLRSVDALDPDRQREYRVLDLGTGTGCLLLSLLHELPQAQGVGVDISGAALNCAERNADALGLSARAVWRRGDMWSALSSSAEAATASAFDIIVTNPPYIPAADIAGLMPEVRLYEPQGALCGGEDGLDFYRTIAAQLPRYLQVGGIFAAEIGFDQAEAVSAIFQPFLNTPSRIIRDLAGLPRVVYAAPLRD